MTRIAIIGAGTAGLAVAYGLRTHRGTRTVFEKSRGYGGRAATRGRGGMRYDHGAPFFGAPSARVKRVVTAHLPTAQLLEVGRPVGAFGADGPVDEPVSEFLHEQKWTYRQGMSTLGKLLARGSGAEVRHTTRITRLDQRADDAWRLWDKEGTRYGPYEAVVLTPPAPQAARILDASSLPDTPFGTLHRALGAVRYVSQFAYVFAFDRTVARPGEVCGLVSVDDEQMLSWIGFEHDKRGRVPAGHSLLVVHTAPAWTRERVDRDPEQFEEAVRHRTASVLGATLDDPLWTDTQRWRYARPQATLDEAARTTAAANGLYVVGDCVTERGTVGEALDAGLETAGELRQALGT